MDNCDSTQIEYAKETVLKAVAARIKEINEMMPRLKAYDEKKEVDERREREEKESKEQERKRNEEEYDRNHFFKGGNPYRKDWWKCGNIDNIFKILECKRAGVAENRVKELDSIAGLATCADGLIRLSIKQAEIIFVPFHPEWAKEQA